MKQAEFKSLLKTHDRFKVITDFEKLKIDELVKCFDDELCTELAISISADFKGYLKRMPLNLATLLNFLRDELFSRAEFKASKTELVGAPSDLTNYQKEQLLTAFYFKSELKRLPQWARKLNYNDEKRKKDE